MSDPSPDDDPAIATADAGHKAEALATGLEAQRACHYYITDLSQGLDSDLKLPALSGFVEYTDGQQLPLSRKPGVTASKVPHSGAPQR